MTIDSKKSVLYRTELTRARIREKAKQQGLLRTADARIKVETAMAKISKELLDNGGAYPYNKGSVSAAEVARRAGIHATTLFSPTQKELGRQVKEWVAELKNPDMAGNVRRRLTHSERITHWKNLYEGLAQSHRDTELELQAKELALEQAQSELEKAKLENKRLKLQLEKNNVISMM